MFGTTVPLFPGVPGGPELLVILLIAVLLFGANKIPKLARSTGEAMGEFQKGREEVEQELEEMRQGRQTSGGEDRTSTEDERTSTEDETAPERTADSAEETETEADVEAERES